MIPSFRLGVIANVLQHSGVIPTDPHFAQVALLLHGNGANGSTTIADSSNSAKTPTSHSATISSANSPMGTGSIHFSGGTSVLRYGASTDWNFGSGDFTIECRVYPISRANYAILACSWGVQTSWIFIIGSSGELGFFWSGSNFSTLTPNNAVPLNTWSAVAVSRKGSDLWLYVNGVAVLHTSITTALAGSADGMAIGSDSGGGSISPCEWYQDETRITKGTDRYGGATYTPATAEWPNS